jgi:hypothetical protein
LDLTRSATPVQEWIYHKTADNLHPDGYEQQMMWLMNRARSNPSDEGAWLAATGDDRVEGAIAYWGVNLDILQAEFDGYAPKPPAAFDVRLYNAAQAHSDDLIARDAQDHDGQFDRIDEAGFKYTRARGNVFAYTENALYGHAAFNIDWGDDGGDGSGMQSPRGHRLALMSIDGDYTNAGLAMVPDSNPDTSVGPLVTTGNFCSANTGYTNHYNRFLVGTVWQDANNNDQYDPGEGMPGITVSPDQGTYYAITANSGGYTIPILAAGTFTVTFTGPGINPAVTRSAVVASQSVMLDLSYTPGSAAAPQAITGTASSLSDVSANLNGSVITQGQATDYYFQYGTTTAYGTDTATDTISADASVTAVISGLVAGSTYHFRLVATSNEGTGFGVDQTFQTNASTPAQSIPTSAPGAQGSGSGGGCFVLTTLFHYKPINQLLGVNILSRY